MVTCTALMELIRTVGHYGVLLALCGILLQGPGVAIAQDQAPAPATGQAPATVTDDAVRLLELGKLLMGQNNPAYAVTPTNLDFVQRNAAGEQALRTFRAVVKLHPQDADGWMWLGISLTETLVYSKEHPQGDQHLNEVRISEGVQAFKTAYERNPAELVYVSYYGEALMIYRKDFDTARKIWDSYHAVARTDLQRVTALVQAARACLNKAYFGKSTKMPLEEIKQYYTAANTYVQRAAKLCPKASDVKEMQQLLKQQYNYLCGK